MGVVIWNKFYLKLRFLCLFQGAHLAEAYRKCPSSIRTQEEVTGSILPSSGKSGVLDFRPNVIKFYLNELPVSLLSICKMKEGSANFHFSMQFRPMARVPAGRTQNLETGSSPVQSSSVTLHVKWIKHRKQSFHVPPLQGDHRTEWPRSPSAWNEIFQLLFPWVIFLQTWIQVSVGNVFLLLKEET